MKYLTSRLSHLIAVLSACISMSTLSADLSYYPVTAVDGSGNLTTAWTLISNTDQYWIAATNFDGSTWSSPIVLNDFGPSDPRNGFDSYDPRMVGDSSGNVVVAWILADDTYGVHALAVRMYDPINGWGATSVLSTTTEDVADTIDLKLGSGGDLSLTWNSYDTLSGDTSIMNSTATFGGSWSSPAVLYTGSL